MLYVNLIVVFMFLTLIIYCFNFGSFFKVIFFNLITGLVGIISVVFAFPQLLNFNFFTIALAMIEGFPGLIFEILIKKFLL